MTGHADTVREALDMLDGERSRHTGAGEPCPVCDTIVAAASALDALVAELEQAERNAADQVTGHADTERPEDFASFVRLLKRAGLTIREITERLDVSESAVKRALYPNRVAWERAYGRDVQRQGICVDCGTTISSNVSRPAKRCRPCYHAQRRITLREARP